MMNDVIIILCTAAVVLATVTTLASKAETRVRLAGGATLIAAVGGLFTYGYAYAASSEYLPLSVLRAAMAVLGMFLGRNEYTMVSETELFSTAVPRFFFWVLHFLAMYATASAVFTALGTSVLHQLRMFLAKMRDITIVYGVTSDTIPLGLSLVGRGNAVVFVDDSVNSADYQAIVSEGGLVCTDENALTMSEKFIKRMGIRKKGCRVCLYAIHPDHSRSLDYARTVLSALREAEIPPEKTRLVLLGYEDITGETFLDAKGKYGYGSVSVFDEADLTARLLIRQYPPCGCLSFDENGKADEDFDVLIVGFGKLGQAVLDELIMHGQFSGSRFHAAVFDPRYQRVNGYLQHEQQGLLKHYSIDFYGDDARSAAMFEYLQKHRNTLKYVAVCIRDETANTRLAQELTRYLIRLSCGASLFQCMDGCVRRMSRGRTSRKKYSIYSPDLICSETLDRMAMIVNQAYYRDSGRSKEENWKTCDYFSRMSCRAFADFVPAILKASGLPADTDGSSRPEGWPWETNRELLENLACTEHMRWCAFHYVMGYEAMDQETLNRRAEQFQKEAAEEGAGKINITKDRSARLHACLIPWEELDGLSRFVSGVTGVSRDYRQMDVDNILSVPEILRQAREE